MKYMVMVTRHHDGFALWDSPGSYKKFNSMETGAKRDFVKEYVEACRSAGLRAGFYYSPMDWRFPGYFHPKELIDNALLMKKQTYDQVEELMTKYGTIDILWYDGAWLAHEGSDTSSAWFWEPEKLNTMVKRLQPKIVVNPSYLKRLLKGWTKSGYGCAKTGKAFTEPAEDRLNPLTAFTEVHTVKTAFTCMCLILISSGN